MPGKFLHLGKEFPASRTVIEASRRSNALMRKIISDSQNFVDEASGLPLYNADSPPASIMSTAFLRRPVQSRALTAAGPSPIDCLAEALSAERRLLDELSAVVRRQRAAVAVDDMDVVSDCVFATHRMLVTLREARAHRQSIGALIGLPAGADAGTDSLERALGARMTPGIRTARDELHEAARALAREVAESRGHGPST